MTWHRLRTVCAERDGGWNMTLYSSDSRFLVWGDNSAPVDEVLADPELSLEEKKRRSELLLRERNPGRSGCAAV